jgi:hypothetical protein
MTLILSRASDRYALHVSDRLVTTNGRPYDPLANKTIIFFARDAIVVFGYTGLAYVGNTPTDTWLVEQLLGEPIAQFAVRPKFYASWPDIGQVMDHLAASVATLLRSSPAKDFDLVGTGWHFNDRRRRIDPMIWCIGHTADRGAEVRRLPRYWQYPRQFRLCCAPSVNVPFGVFAKLMGPLGGPSDTEGALVQFVREIALNNPYVGPHCMTVLAPNPKISREISACYRPAAPLTATVALANSIRELPAAFSPWIVARQLQCPPAIMIGGFEAHIGAFTVRIEAPAHSGPVHWALSSQRRPKPYR